MKKLFIAVVALALFSCGKEEKAIDYVVFSGKIENPDGGKFSIRNSEKVIKEILVLDDGTFTDTLQKVDKGYYTFKYANETASFYLTPGYNLNLSLDPKQFDESIKYMGNGSDENNYLTQKFLNEEGLGKLATYQHLGTLEENAYIHLIDSIKQLELDFLNKQENINKDFKTLEEASITYGEALKLSKFELYKRFVTKNDDFVKSDEFPDFKAELNLEDENLLALSNYKNYLNSHYGDLASEIANKDSTDYDITYLNTVSKEVKSPKIKEFLLFGAAKYNISYTKELQNYYDTFMANSTDEEHKEDIKGKYNKLIKLTKGNASPKFVDYENYAGGTTSLDDLKGKYVYVDVWATWCGPCKREIPSLKKLEKEYHDNNIAFVSMSIDRKNDYDKWRAMVKEKELSGVQIYAPNDWKSDFVTDYGILGIPRFILIDPKGNIVDSNAPRPSSDKLKELLNELNI